MKRTFRTTIVAGMVVAVLCGSACVSRRRYRACEDKLAQAGEPAFTVTIDNDGFGQFMPTNNQFWKQPMPAKYYGGFLVQLATMKEAQHIYSNVEITMADGSTTSLGRSEAEWVNIVCEQTPGTPISVDQARLLLPQLNKSDTYARVVHGSIKPETVSLLTIWRSDQPVSVQSSAGEAAANHGHDKFVFSSPAACGVQVWKAISQSTPTTTYQPGQVKAVRILAKVTSTPHGGVHQPWWDFSE